MKSSVPLLLALLLPVGALWAALADDVEFNGVVVIGDRVKVSLIDAQSGAAGWVRVGGSFAGFVVAAYDPVKETVTLTHDGQPMRRIQLKEAVILLARPSPPWMQPSNEQRATVAENLRQLAGAAAQFYAATGADTATLDDLVGPGKPIEQLASVAGENYAGIVVRRDLPSLNLTTSDGTRISSDGTSTAADGSTITADGGRIATDGTAYAPDGKVIDTVNPSDPVVGPFIPPNTIPQVAETLQAMGWKFRPPALTGP
ncbi:MAG: hypothetical protein WCL04_04480 [Verrucomicrobiota bacterium]